MTPIYVAAALIAGALMFLAGTVTLVVVGLSLAFEEERRGGCRGEGCRRRPDWQGRIETRGADGPGPRVISQEDRT